jgi:hypothetical protein
MACCASPGWLWSWRNRWNDWQGKPKYSEKTCLSVAFPPQTPHATRTRTRAAAVGSQRLTAWATALPCSIVPQPTTLPRADEWVLLLIIINTIVTIIITIVVIITCFYLSDHDHNDAVPVSASLHLFPFICNVSFAAFMLHAHSIRPHYPLLVHTKVDGQCSNWEPHRLTTALGPA